MVPLGIEPRTYCVLSRCDNQLHHGTLLMLSDQQKPSRWNDDANPSGCSSAVTRVRRFTKPAGMDYSCDWRVEQSRVDTKTYQRDILPLHSSDICTSY
jgi:hypothetical protein